MTVEMKKCSKCGIEKPKTNEFFRWKNKKNGELHNICKECVREYERNRGKKKAKEEGREYKTVIRVDRSNTKEGCKICSKCKKELPSTNEFFGNLKISKDGLDLVCKVCKSEKSRLEKLKKAKEEGREYKPYFKINPKKEGNKVCIKCNQEYPITSQHFTRSKKSKDGFFSTCKYCVSKQNKEKARIKAEQEGREYISRDSYKSSKEGFKKCSCCKSELPNTEEYFRWNNKSKGKLTTKCRNCINTYEKNRAKKKAKEEGREYNERIKLLPTKEGYKFCICCLKEKPATLEYFSHSKVTKDGLNGNCKKCLALKSHNRRATKEGNGGNYTPEQWQECLDYFDNKCAYSGVEITKDNTHVEHIIPVSKGGTSWIWNLVPSLDKVNFSKNDRNMEEWYRTTEYFSEERLQKIYEYQEYMKNKYKEKDVA